MNDCEIDHLDYGLERVAELVRIHGRAGALRQLQRLMTQLSHELFPGRRFTLRTLRHQARANMVAAGQSRAEIAATLGHVSADSQATYGERLSGKAGRTPAREALGLAALVRRQTRPVGRAARSATAAPKMRLG